MLDDEIDRTAYDAELYDGQNDGTCIHLTNNQQKPSSLTSLFVFELQQLMDDIITEAQATISSRLVSMLVDNNSVRQHRFSSRL